MNPRQIDLLRDSFVHVLFGAEEAAEVFYRRLFTLAPDTRVLFCGDMAEQGRVLIQALAKIIAGLSRPADMMPELCALAMRHVGYGVEERHYAIVGDALLHMVAVQAGDAFDRATETAWCEAYNLVASAMIAAARDAAAVPVQLRAAG